MKRYTIIRFSVLAVGAFCLCLNTGLQAEEEFQGRLIPELGPSSQQAIKLIMTVSDYTSAEEVFKLIEAFNAGSYDQFLAVFREMDKGVVRPTGGRGMRIPIHAAQSIQTEKGRKILLFGESQSWSLDSSLRLDGRFPYLIIELEIDNKGKGKGKIYLAADIRLNADGTIEMSGYSMPPRQLFGVSASK